MQDGKQVEENLAVIRRLMERGTQYEAVTSAGSLLAGFAAGGAAAFVRWGPWHGEGAFVLTWVALAVSAAAGVAFQGLRGSRSSDPEGRRISAQARAVASEVLPAYLAAGVLTVLLWRAGRVDLLPATWMLLHGVAILSTAAHAPRRLVWLGVAFIAAGTTIGLLDLDRRIFMPLVFGGFHVAYGLVARFLSRDEEA